MKRKSGLLFLLVAFAFGITTGHAQMGLTTEQLEIKEKTKPYLDSLVIEEPTSDNEDVFRFRLESLFPEKDFTQFGTNEGVLYSFTPKNPLLFGLVTDPIPLLGGARISLVYSFTSEDDKKLLIDKRFRFESLRETDQFGGKQARQALLLSMDKEIPFSKIKVGMMDVLILPPEDIERREVTTLPELAYRSMSFSKESDGQYYLTYLLRDSEGVYGPILRSEGSDRTYPEYIGGRSDLFYFFKDNMQYPEEARDNNISGTVLVACTIGKDGTVINPRIFLSSESLLEDEALRLVGLTSGKWIPATHNGENIDDEKVIPVSFYFEGQMPDNIVVGGKVVGTDKGMSVESKVIVFVIFLVFLFFIFWLRNKMKKPVVREPRPTTLVGNDKIVIVAGIDSEEMELMLSSFTEIYNTHSYEAIICMHPMGKHVFALTFPYDIDWIVFMELIDHIIYFDGDEQKAKIRAWLSLPEQLGQHAGKHVMLYENKDDKDFDLIWFTTPENTGWKYDFETEQLKEAEVKEEYAEAPFTYQEIWKVEGREID